MKFNWKRLFVVLILIGLMLFAGVAAVVITYSSQLPQIITLKDYKPNLVSEVYDRHGEKIGEYFREKRILVPYEKMPKVLIDAFVAAEDSNFFSHGGINILAIFRAMMKNIKAGRKVQGASTITQQVARSLLLTRDKTYKRKIKEILLARKMEANLSKEEILYLYLNQIYLGHGAHGVEMASQIYFRKPATELNLGEAALLAGLPQAPSRYSPVYNSKSSKARQRYVLNRMVQENFIKKEEADKFAESDIRVFVRKNYTKNAPYFMESLRQLLVDQIGENKVLDEGLKIYTSLDLEKQLEAQKLMKSGLRDLDKRQGFRGPIKNLTASEDIKEFLDKTKEKLINEKTDARIIQPDGTFADVKNIPAEGQKQNQNLPAHYPHYFKLGLITEGIVTEVNDKWGYVKVTVAEGKGIINFDEMTWARKPDPNKKFEHDKLKKPSNALKKGDVILVKVGRPNFKSPRLEKLVENSKIPANTLSQSIELFLEQDPVVQGALISFDQETQELISMVGGYDFETSKYNRAYQAARQTGSAFKSIVYAAALDNNYTPATPIMDAPIVYEESTDINANDEEGQMPGEGEKSKIWKPSNHSNNFLGDILFRNALIKSKNIPTIKIIEKLGVEWVADYARRLGIFSPLNMDFTLALGTSSVTLYEMTKVFSQFGRLGKRIRPIIIHKIENSRGEVLVENISFDQRFEKEIQALDKKFNGKRAKSLAKKKNSDPENSETPKKPKLYFNNPDQLISPQTAYLTTTLLKGVVQEGTGGKALSLKRPVAGKTGTTNGYYDGWFVGYTRDIATGVWVGFDNEKTLGIGEVGGKVALPIWVSYMQAAHKNLPERSFQVPSSIVFANIDNKTGKLASAESEKVVNQAFLQGTEPTVMTGQSGDDDDEQDFYKQELNE